MRRLAGCVAAMSRFISKSFERALPFFKILKKACPMEWTPEAEAALQDLKRYLSSVPILVAPRTREPLLLYFAATNQVVSAALVAQREIDDKVMAATEPDATDAETTQPIGVPPKKKMMQHQVYFVSSLLQGG